MPPRTTSNKLSLIFTTLLLLASLTHAAPQFGLRPPSFINGMPGRVQMQSIVQQRHQTKTLLYRKAIAELRRNPKIADIPQCTRNIANAQLCLPIQKITEVPLKIANQPIANRRALFIGNQLYRDPTIPQLDTPMVDIGEIATKLQEKFDFTNIRILKDATKADTVTAMSALATEVQPGDSVLIFYAGHGYLMDDTGMGYWIPIDGAADTAVQWISNQDISKFLHAIAARQIILISDSCFSGSLTKESRNTIFAKDITAILAKRSVIAFSSGGEEPVSDVGRDGHSVFAWHFSKSLDKLHGISLGYNLFDIVKLGVITDYPQTPQYGAMISAGHQEGGEYLFITNYKPR